MIFDKKDIIEKTFKSINESKSKSITYTKFREILSLDRNFEFKDLDYTKTENKKSQAQDVKLKNPESKNFIEIKPLKYLSDAFGNEFDVDIKILDEICTKITYIKDINDLKKALQPLLMPLNLTNLNNVLNSLCEISFNDHIELSLEAIYKILPFMQDGYRYDEACRMAGLEQIKTDQKSEFLPPFNESYHAQQLTNPVVKRAISQYRKVLNALIKKYGKPHEIHFELTRDVGKNFSDRRATEKEQAKNRKLNEEAIKFCKDNSLQQNSSNILKAKLFLRQSYNENKEESIDIYSGEKIKKEYLSDEKLLEVDHIYPLSRSFDDSQNNKVLVFVEQNQNKGNRTPAEWFGDDEEKWAKFISIINSTGLPDNTKKRLTNRNFKDKEEGFISRNLNDTSYIANLIKDYTNENLDFLPISSDDNGFNKQHVVCINGSLTSMLRHFWGLDDKDRSEHLHHAVDAIILAFATRGHIKAFADYKSELIKTQIKAKELAQDIKTKDIRTSYLLKRGVANLRDVVNKQTGKIFVAHAPRRKVTGAIHQETIISKDTILKEYKTTQKIEQYSEYGILNELNGGYVKNDSMSRVDVFKKGNKFYIVPIYPIHFSKGKLPNKAVTTSKNGWLEMDESYEFCFSLFKNDLLKIKTKNASGPEFYYFNGFDIATNTINYKPHISNNHIRSSAGTFEIFEKWEVTVLGEKQKCQPQDRKPVRLKDTKRR